MPRYVAFLRAINVGGRVVRMETLRAAFERLQYANVETFIASGNVIFDTPSRATGPLETRIEAALRAALGYEVATFVRTLDEVAAIARHRPFEPKVLAEAAALNVGLLKSELPQETVRAVEALGTAVDELRVNGSELYWMSRVKQSESKLSNALFERTLKAQATFRNIRTIEKLAAKYAALKSPMAPTSPRESASRRAAVRPRRPS